MLSIILALPLLLLSTHILATPISTADTGLGGMIRVEDIPIGAVVNFGGDDIIFNGTIPDSYVSELNALLATGASSNPAPSKRRLQSRAPDVDCQGSVLCGSVQISREVCIQAYQRFTPNTFYCGNRRRYASRKIILPGSNFSYTERCLAIFEPHPGYCKYRGEMGNAFNLIHERGCKDCGRNRNDLNANYRLDYCSSNCDEY